MSAHPSARMRRLQVSLAILFLVAAVALAGLVLQTLRLQQTQEKLRRSEEPTAQAVTLTRHLVLTCRLPDNCLVLSQNPEWVKLVFQAPQDWAALLASPNWHPQITILPTDLTGPEGRTQTLAFPLNRGLLGLPSGVKLLSVEPEMVEVTVDRIVSRAVPVRLELTYGPGHTIAPEWEGKTDGLAKGFCLGRTAVAPPTVRLRGPSSILAGMTHCTFSVDVTGRSSGWTEVREASHLLADSVSKAQARFLEAAEPVQATIEVRPAKK